MRVLRTERVQRATEAPEGLQATVIWPADRDLDHEQILALADPLFELDPPWGSYGSVGQMRMESPTSATFDNHLDVTLTSLDSIDPLAAFCEQHYPNSIVLIHCDADQVLVLSGEQILRDYGGAGGD